MAIPLAQLSCASLLIAAQGLAGKAPSIDPRAEVAAALYAAAATEAAAERIADVKIREQRIEINGLQAKLQAGAANVKELKAQLTSAQEKYVAELAARDRSYARQIAVFRENVKDIAATPDGAAALARFNSGDEAGALAILDDIQKANDLARKKRADIESAAESRRIAALALEARAKGKQTTAQVTDRYEKVTRLDPDVSSDWIELARLYIDAGTLPKALNAVKRAAETASNEADRAFALYEMGNVLLKQGDGPGALDTYRKAIGITKGLAAQDPANIQWQSDLSLGYCQIGDVLVNQGDLRQALESYIQGREIMDTLAIGERDNTYFKLQVLLTHTKIGDVQVRQGDWLMASGAYRVALGIAERLSKQDPSNTEWQRLLSICHGEIGIVLAAQGDEPGALAEYRKGLGITEWLAAQDPANTKWQRDLSVSHLKIGNVLAGQDNKPGAVAEYDKSLKITQALAEQDPANADWQRDLVDLEKLSEVTGDRAYAAKALNVALDMQKRGLLAPTDVWMIEELRRRVGQ